MSHCVSHTGSEAASVTLGPGALGASFPGALLREGTMETAPRIGAEKMNRAIGCPFQSLCWGEWRPGLGTQARFLELRPCRGQRPAPAPWTHPVGNVKEGLAPAPGKGRAGWCLCPWESLGSRRPPEERFPPSLPQLAQAADQTPEPQVPAEPPGSTQVLLRPRVLVTKRQGNSTAPSGSFLMN